VNRLVHGFFDARARGGEVDRLLNGHGSDDARGAVL
jgi:hypothetical protein